MSTLTLSDFHVGQKLKILTGWHAGAVALITRITDERVTAHVEGRVVTFLAGGLPQMRPEARK